MMLWLTGIRALAGLTVTEAIRQRLWLVFVLAAAGLVLATPSLTAVDEGARLKLSVVAILGVMSFVATMLAMLVGASALRRDLDARLGFALFSKPLRRSAYLLGRWCGVQTGLLLGLLPLCLVGTAIIAWQFAGLPTIRAVRTADSWQHVGSFGQVSPIDEARSRLQLGGAPGNGVRWTFSGLPTSGVSASGLELLVRVGVRSFDPFEPALDLSAQVTALPPAAGGNGRAATVRVLELDPQSPYGHQRANAPVPPGQVVLRDRDESRNDLGQDYLRLRLPADCIGTDGTAVIQLIRLEARGAVIASRSSSMEIAVPGGGFLVNLVRGSLVLLAAVGLLVAWTLLCATLANLPVALFGGLTLFFAGSAMPVLRTVARYDDTDLWLRRMLELALSSLPDFDRYNVAARLAASEAIDWNTVGAAWSYYGAYSAIFLLLAWAALVRKEM